MNDPIRSSRHRLHLWLRSERAFGLKSVPAIGPAPESFAQELEEPRAAVAEEAGFSPRAMPAAEALFVPASPAAPTQPRAGEEPAPAAFSFDAPELSPDEKRTQLTVLDRDQVRGCTLCGLSRTRKQTVFGEGDPNARLFFVGEGPGRTEDQTGRPFVGRAGELLTRMIQGMGLRREDVFIANILKCRAFVPGPPPKDRAPTLEEVTACTPYLLRQLEVVRPRVIVTLGLPAAKYMLQSNLSMGRLRGKWHEWRGIRLMPTYHPAFVLREYERGEEAKRAVRAAVWQDLTQVLDELGLPRPAARSGGDG